MKIMINGEKPDLFTATMLIEAVIDELSTQEERQAMVCTLIDYVAGKQNQTGDQMMTDIMPIMKQVNKQEGILR